MTDSKVEHTPGPYRAEWRESNIVRRESDLLPWIDGIGSFDSMANAKAWAERLNAAYDRGKNDSGAPDLLAACEAICGVYEGFEDVPQYVLKARAAIAKARGEK